MAKQGMSLQVSIFASALLVTVGLFGCSAPVRPTPTPIQTSADLSTAAAPSAATIVLAGAQTGVATMIPTPVPLPTQAAAKSPPTPTPVPTAATMKVKIFLIAIEDGGKSAKKIGCNDSVVPIEGIIPATTAPLTAAIRQLVSMHDQNYGQSGLYNALYKSNLRIGSINLANGKATMNLLGTLAVGGTCDSPRITAQIRETALQFSTVKQVVVQINGVALEKALSTK